MALTGTLTSKSPLNMVDQYQYLDKEAFPWGMFALAELLYYDDTSRTEEREFFFLNTQEKTTTSWCGIRKRLSRAWAIGGKARLLLSMNSVSRAEYFRRKLWWIICHKKYKPFKDISPLMKRYQYCTEIVSREDALILPLKSISNILSSVR